MSLESGQSVVPAFAPEGQWGVLPGTNAGRALRRNALTLNLKTEMIDSNEIRPDRNRADRRQGGKKVEGQYQFDLTPGNQSLFIAAVLARDFSAVAPVAGASFTIAVSGLAYTITRAAGSFLAAGIVIGMVVRLTAGPFNAANLNKNLLVVAAAVDGTNLTVLPINGTNMVPEGPIAGATLTVPGKRTIGATSGHTDKSFTFERWCPNIPTSMLYTGCVISKMSLSLPTTGAITGQCDLMGKTMTTQPAQYFANPAPAVASSCMAACGGIARMGGQIAGVITQMSLDISTGRTPVPGAMTRFYAAIPAGTLLISGSMSVTFENMLLMNAFLNETDTSIQMATTVDDAPGSDFVGITLHRLKLESDDVNDVVSALTQSITFSGLLNLGGGVGQTTDYCSIAVQDSQA